jgi:hypothetical protein
MQRSSRTAFAQGALLAALALATATSPVAAMAGPGLAESSPPALVLDPPALTPPGPQEASGAPALRTSASSLDPGVYLLPGIEVPGVRTLVAPEGPILAWTDTDRRGVFRDEADATALRAALDLRWLMPFSW